MKYKYLAIAILFFSCTTRNHFFYGTYTKKNAILKLDSKYRYTYSDQYFFINEHCSGIYVFEHKNKINLNSDYQEKTMKSFFSNKTYNRNLIADSITFIASQNVLASNDVLFYINDTLKIPSYRDSMYFIYPVTKNQKIEIALTCGKHFIPSRIFDTIKSKPLYNGGDNNVYDIKIDYNDSMFRYKIMTNEKIILKRKGLIYNGLFFKKITTP